VIDVIHVLEKKPVMQENDSVTNAKISTPIKYFRSTGEKNMEMLIE